MATDHLLNAEEKGISGALFPQSSAVPRCKYEGASIGLTPSLLTKGSTRVQLLKITEQMLNLEQLTKWHKLFQSAEAKKLC